MAELEYMTWVQRHDVKHVLFDCSSSTQNAYMESFNGTFRYKYRT